ncbi:MAG: hypothetical protein Ct9H300mP8_03770 [Gammaproteobacteria bacterium]|nr:MAG: hypothetical protein Ct9H300mP8_03770 [Gammaproteobacteria bacterium]
MITDRLISIDLVCDLNDELLNEGYAREAVNRIQRARRDSGLNVSDRIRLVYSGDERILEALKIHAEYVAGETLATEFELGPTEEFDAEIDGCDWALIFPNEEQLTILGNFTQPPRPRVWEKWP